MPSFMLLFLLLKEIKKSQVHDEQWCAEQLSWTLSGLWHEHEKIDIGNDCFSLQKEYRNNGIELLETFFKLNSANRWFNLPQLSISYNLTAERVQRRYVSNAYIISAIHTSISRMKLATVNLMKFLEQKIRSKIASLFSFYKIRVIWEPDWHCLLENKSPWFFWD